jgi:hypothetical protein
MHDNWREFLGTLILAAMVLAVTWLLNQFGVRTDFDTVFLYLLAASCVLFFLYLGARARALARFCLECGARREADSQVLCARCGTQLMDKPGWAGYVIMPIALVAAALAVYWALGQLGLGINVLLYLLLALIVLFGICLWARSASTSEKRVLTAGSLGLLLTIVAGVVAVTWVVPGITGQAAGVAEPTATPVRTPTPMRKPVQGVRPLQTPARHATPVSHPGTVLLADDFDDPVSGRLPKPPDSAQSSVRYVEGEYMVVKFGATPGAYSVQVGSTYADASLAVEARLVGETDQRYIGLSCRGQDTPPGGYDLEVAPSTDQFRLGRLVEGRMTYLVPWESSPAIRRGNESNHLELACSGTTIAVAINGTQVASVQDNTYLAGRMSIGVGAQPGSGVAEARFDNLVLTAR